MVFISRYFTLSLREGVKMMQHGLQLYDRSTVVCTVVPGANRYERYSSFEYSCMYLS